MPSPEAPPQSYFPRCRVRLIIRFEEFGRVFNTPAPPRKPPQLRTGKGVDNKGVLNVVRDGDAFVLRAKDEQTTHQGGTPQDQTSSSDNRTHVLEGIIPLRCTISRNGIRTADTCTIELHTLDFPFDPRVIRSCGVQVYLGCVTEQDVQLETSGGSGPNVNRSHQIGGNGEGALVPVVCPDEFTDDKGRRRSNLRFEGFVDVEDVEYPNGDASTVKLEATDNTRLLIDQDAPPKLTVTADQPLDVAVANYLANFPQFRGLRVEYRPAGADVPVLKKALAKSAFKPNAGPPPTGGAGAGGGGQQKLSVWDYLTDLAGSLGLIVRMEGVTVIFQRPRTLYSSKFSGRVDDPFTGRTLASGRFVSNRLYVYGRNIEDLSFSRKITKFAPTNVEVRCYSGRKGQTLTARFPTKEDRQKLLLPGNAADEKWTVFTVSGIEDLGTLRAIAQSVYEAQGRQELGCKFKTHNLASFGGGNLDPDALDAEAGDAIEVEIHREIEGANSIGQVQDQVQARAENYLRSLGYGPGIAKAYGDAIGQVGLPTTFRVRSLAINWDAETEGVSFDFEITNFIEVRQSKDLPAGEEINPSGVPGATAARSAVQDKGRSPGAPRR